MITLNGLTGITTPGETVSGTGVWSVGGTQLYKDASGNLGLGVTPSAWYSLYKAYQFGIGGSLIGRSDNAGLELTANAYRNTSGNYIYLNTDYSTSYRQYTGQHQWWNSTSGTAGNAISFTQAMTLDAGGNLLVGRTSVSTLGGSGRGLIDVNGSSDSAMTFGAAGTVYGYLYGATNEFRVGNITANPLTFFTNNTERARIDSSGRLLIGTTSNTSAGVSSLCQVNSEIIARGTSAGVFWENRSGGVTSNSNWYGWYGAGGSIYLFNGAGNAASINASTGAYTALSDKNKKKDFEPSAIGLDAVLALKPTLFRMKDAEEGSPKELGFIAQDVKDVIPQAYIEHTAIDAGGKESTYIGLNDRPIIAALVKAIQELSAELNELKQKVNA